MLIAKTDVQVAKENAVVIVSAIANNPFLFFFTLMPTFKYVLLYILM